MRPSGQQRIPSGEPLRFSDMPIRGPWSLGRFAMPALQGLSGAPAGTLITISELHRLATLLGCGYDIDATMKKTATGWLSSPLPIVATDLVQYGAS
ncbi:hypothetical protein CBM2600_A140360 [Cupriavidus taiwanensis]|nr:hypothetical protein CBM2600_A140360 [Cupriavidus taiwanensis]